MNDPLWPYLGVLGFILGAIFGSFFNVLIYRLPRGESILRPGSRCTQCQSAIAWYYNIPLISWFLLGGKCASCQVKIKPGYLAVEWSCAILGGIIACLFGQDAFPPDRIGALYLWTLISIPVAVLDWKYLTIPDGFSYFTMGIGFLISFLPGGLTPLQSLLGLAGSGLFLFTVGYLVSLLKKKDTLGFGDVKWIAAAGSLIGLHLTLIGIFTASLLGLLYLLILLLWSKKNLNSPLPFAPFLSLGVLISTIFGPSLI